MVEMARSRGNRLSTTPITRIKGISRQAKEKLSLVINTIPKPRVTKQLWLNTRITHHNSLSQRRSEYPVNRLRRGLGRATSFIRVKSKNWMAYNVHSRPQPDAAERNRNQR